MRQIIFIILVLLAAPAFAIKGGGDISRIELRKAPVAQVIQLILSEMETTAYVISPAVLSDVREVSFRYDSKMGDFRSFLKEFLDSLGLSLNSINGVLYITKKSEEKSKEVARNVYVYRPHYRDGSYLADLLAPLFEGQFTAKKMVHASPGDMVPQQAVPNGSAAAQIDRKSETLVFLGSDEEIERLKQVMPLVDVARKDVMVQGILCEVQTSSSDGSAFNLAASLLGGKIGVSLGQSVDPVSNALRFANASINVVLSVLSSDSRFNVVSKPSLRVASGEVGKIVVGQDVPVLTQLSYGANGNTPLQSVEYRSSGVIFDVQPIVRESVVDLTVVQQVSNFVSTNTGVNSSPTLIKREIRSSLSLADGEIVVIGGVSEDKNSNTRSGFRHLPDFFQSNTDSSTKTEILLILKMSRL
jgi:type II secretory pathway component GspD/PulD (secretin)